jgi:DNA-binding CsgD family transcriptional regulator
VKTPAAYLLMTNVPPHVWQASVYDHPQVIGRLPECDIVIPGEHVRVSRQHAVVGADHDGLWIRDLGSSGGTQLNGVPLIPRVQTRAVIGDRVLLGGLELYFVSPEASVLDDSGILVCEKPQGSRTTLLFTASPLKPSGAGVPLHLLSPAELEVVRWICRGLTNVDEIGRKLFRSPHTVRTQLGSVFKKLEVHSREELIAVLRRCEIAWTQPDSTDVAADRDALSPRPKEH